MAGSSSYIPSQLPGLTLRAWALFTGTGTLLKGFNVASVGKGGTGNFTVTFTTALADVSVFTDCRPLSNTSAIGVLGFYATVGTGSSQIVTLNGGALADPSVCYVAYYG